MELTYECLDCGDELKPGALFPGGDERFSVTFREYECPYCETIFWYDVATHKHLGDWNHKDEEEFKKPWFGFLIQAMAKHGGLPPMGEA